MNARSTPEDLLARQDRALDRKTVTGNARGQRPENLAFFPAIDGLRWLAFTLVFLNHYISLPWAFGGVDIFFVISGFLITGILVDTRQDAHRLRNFYVRRTLRIFPLYYAVLIAFAIATPVFRWNWSRYWLAWPLYVGNFLSMLDQRSPTAGHDRYLAANGYLHAGHLLAHPIFFGALWSLCIEEQFYLVWPFLVYAIRRQVTLLRLCFAGCILIPLLRFAAQALAPSWMLEQQFLYRITPLRVDALLFGAALALLWRGQYRQQLRRIAAWGASAMIAISLVYFAATLHRFTLTGLEQYRLPGWTFTTGFLWIDLLSVWLVVLCLTPGNLVARIFTTPLLRSLGRLTYGAYVFHDLFHSLLANAAIFHRLPSTLATVLLVGCAYCITFVLAWLSFRLLETPFLRLKERYTVKDGQRA